MIVSVEKTIVSSSRNTACVGGIGISDSALSVFDYFYEVIAVRLF